MMLETQAQFEELWFDKTNEAKHWIVYFTADWCKACKKLDLEKIMTAVGGHSFYTCNYSVNDYTPGYCGVRTFPTFAFMKPGTIVSKLQSSNTDVVLEWLSKV